MSTASLGRFGIWTSYRQLGEQNLDGAAALAEELGFGALWLGGSPNPAKLTPFLEATDRLVVATGILNIWQTDAVTAARERAELADRFPGRVLMGIGLGHPEATSDYRHPLRAMGTFLDELDAADQPVPEDERCLAALAPRMLELSRERTLGTHSYFVPVEHTRWAREQLGDGPLVAPELACVLNTDDFQARSEARDYAKLYLGLSNYTNALRRSGFSEEDIADGGSDRLIDSVIPHGTAEEIAGVAQAHLEAGADHVCLQTVGVQGVPVHEWTELASALELSS
jgi:probable F420-dependent oxidoreductase